MPRTPTVRYFDSRKAYFCQYQRKQLCLAIGPKDEPDGPTYLAAIRKFTEMMHCAEADRAEDNNLVVTVLDRYAVYLKNQGRTRSLEIFRRCCDSACEEFGHLQVKDLKVMHVQAWLDKMGQARGPVLAGRGGKSVGRQKKWGPTMKRLAVDKLVTALNWGVEQGMLTKNPIKTKPLVRDLKQKGKTSRGREYVMQPGEHAKLLSISKPFFADLIAFLEGTGCRPGEAYNAEAHNFNRADSTIVFLHDATQGYVHKTAKRTGKDRTIYLTPELVELVRRLCLKNPEGPLIRNRDNKPWTNSSVYLMLKRLRKRLCLTGKMIAYSYRHTFATRWLLAGNSIKLLADLMGNSVTIIEKHYGHTEVDTARVRKMVEAFDMTKKVEEGQPPVAEFVPLEQ